MNAQKQQIAALTYRLQKVSAAGELNRPATLPIANDTGFYGVETHFVAQLE